MSKSLRQQIFRPRGDLNPQPSDSCQMLYLLSYWNQTFAIPCDWLLALENWFWSFPFSKNSCFTILNCWDHGGDSVIVVPWTLHCSQFHKAILWGFSWLIQLELGLLWVFIKDKSILTWVGSYIHVKLWNTVTLINDESPSSFIRTHIMESNKSSMPWMQRRFIYR